MCEQAALLDKGEEGYAEAMDRAYDDFVPIGELPPGYTKTAERAGLDPDGGEISLMDVYWRAQGTFTICILGIGDEMSVGATKRHPRLDPTDKPGDARRESLRRAVASWLERSA